MRSVRGLMANPKAGLLLKFQFNPSEIKNDKRVNYDIQHQAGWPHPIVWYQGGGERTIQFSLVFDATDGSNGLDTFRVMRPYGVQDVISVIESFRLPEDGLSTILQTGDLRRFIAPPDCYFVYGMRWAKTKVLEAPITESLFDRTTLYPRRCTVDVRLLVIEEGTVADVESAARRVMAKASGAMDLVTGGVVTW